MAKKEAKVTKKENSKENKNKKSFFKGLKVELKKVVWPIPKQLFNNTVAVITIVLVTAAIVCILNLAFESLNKHGVEKIKESIQTTSTNSTDNNTAETEKTEDTNQTDKENTETDSENNNTETTTEQDSNDNTQQDAQ